MLFSTVDAMSHLSRVLCVRFVFLTRLQFVKKIDYNLLSPLLTKAISSVCKMVKDKQTKLISCL